MKTTPYRVRAILITPDGTMAVIRREKPGVPPYSVFPGGGMDATDASPEAAMRREIQEEIGGEMTDLRLVYTLENELFFLARLIRWTGKQTGPEFAEAGRGKYTLDFVPLSAVALAAINLKPDAAAAFVASHAEHWEDVPTITVEGV